MKTFKVIYDEVIRQEHIVEAENAAEAAVATVPLPYMGTRRSVTVVEIKEQ